MTEKKQSLNKLKARYGVAFKTLQDFKKEGVDIWNPDAFQTRMQVNKPDYVLPERKDSKAKKPKAKTVGVSNTEEGLDAAIKRLRATEVEAHNAYLNAVEFAPDSAPGLLKRWHSTLEILRKIEESNPDIQKVNETVLSKQELSQSLGTLFKNLRQDLEALPLKIATLGQMKDKNALIQIVSDEIQAVVTSMEECKYL